MGTGKGAELHIFSEMLSCVSAVPGSTAQVVKPTLDLAKCLAFSTSSM